MKWIRKIATDFKLNFNFSCLIYTNGIELTAKLAKNGQKRSKRRRNIEL